MRISDWSSDVCSFRSEPDAETATELVVETVGEQDGADHVGAPSALLIGIEPTRPCRGCGRGVVTHGEESRRNYPFVCTTHRPRARRVPGACERTRARSGCCGGSDALEDQRSEEHTLNSSH